MEISRERLCSLVSRHLPVFCLHHDDAFMPCSVPFFLRHCELRGARPRETLVPRGKLRTDGVDLLDFQDLHAGRHLWLHLDPAARRGTPRDRIDEEAPVYAHAKAVVGNNGTVEAVEINYITLYAYNGEYNILPGGMLSVGAHDGDIEHCSARVDIGSGDLLAMWYNSHRSRDGEWVAGDQVPRTSEGRPVAYVARHGHGTYPRPGTVLRHFFLGNDKCSKVGPTWRPRNVVLLPNVHAASRLGGDPGVKLPLDLATTEDGDRAGPEGDPRLVIMRCQSRGCKLFSTGNDNNGNGGLVANNGNHVDPVGEVQVIDNDPCLWLWFRGEWGESTPGMAQQGWFHRAETPVSRSKLQRLFLHFYPETERV
jgi:hypothetical protein